MRLLHIAYFGKNGNYNGIYEAVNTLAMSQAKLGASVKIAITSYQPVVDDKFIYFTPTLREFKPLLDGFSPDLVVFNSLYEFQQITFSHELRKRKIPYVLAFHGGASKDNARKGWLKKKIANVLLWNYFIHMAKAVVYLNNNEYDKSIFKRINKKYFIIPNGVELPVNPPKYEGGKMNVVFLSRIDYYGKGLDVLLPAIEQLKEEGWEDKIQFLFYGFPSDESYKKLSQFGDFLRYEGYVRGEKKADAFRNATLNILPSRSEGMPMTILEALSYGRPCMVTSMTNMGDLVVKNNCGWLIELTVESIVTTIKKAYDEFLVNPNKYYSNCIKVAEEYSWKNIALKTLEMYKKILDKNGQNI